MYNKEKNYNGNKIFIFNIILNDKISLTTQKVFTDIKRKK